VRPPLAGPGRRGPGLGLGLRFNVENQTFEFYASAKMRDDPRWIDVTTLFTQGLEHHIGALNAHPDTQPRIVSYMERLARLGQVLERDFHDEKITGEDKTADVVVDIFNRVNSGGMPAGVSARSASFGFLSS
jgi:hypothetical protein